MSMICEICGNECEDCVPEFAICKGCYRVSGGLL